MTINPKTTCLVLDLDDTLYKEYDYQTSGLSYVARELSALYNIDLNNYLKTVIDYLFRIRDIEGIYRVKNIFYYVNNVSISFLYN